MNAYPGLPLFHVCFFHVFSPRVPRLARPPRPKLRDEPASERPELFRQKLQVPKWGKQKGDFNGFHWISGNIGNNFCWDYGFESNFMWQITPETLSHPNLSWKWRFIIWVYHVTQFYGIKNWISISWTFLEDISLDKTGMYWKKMGF